MATRVPQELGRPVRLHRNLRLGNRNTNSPGPRPGVAGRGEQTTDATVVSPSEGNEAQRNGTAGSRSVP